MINRGRIWDVELDHIKGAKMRKLRPCVVVSSDFVGTLPLRIITPITEW
ncbi:MAG TPA: type II toxin-antitoxin system PemK/MazF family toxin [Firmicutes bacterium]|nr:type II toxin-antitoxin system PemK/MazF family toxin [Bacillota bacterium]